MSVLRQVRAEWSMIGPPMVMAQLCMLGVVAALLWSDRGREPYVRVGVVDHAIDAPGTAAVLALGVAVTWWGVVVVPMGVAAGHAARLEQGLVELRRQFEPRWGRRTLTGFAAVSAVALAGVAALVVAVVVLVRPLAGGGSDVVASIGAADIVAIVSMVAFWWSVSMVIARLTRSAMVTAVLPAALSVVSLALSRLGWTVPYLPTSWLARSVGVRADGNALAAVWADGGGVLDLSWDPADVSIVPIGVCTAVCVVAMWMVGDD